MSKKPVVGFLVSGIMDEFTEKLCKGVFSEAVNDDVNIVVIPVKYINREMKDIPDLYEYQYNENYQNITSANIDVLIVVADCIGCFTTTEKLIEFMDKLSERNVPIILAASKLEGYPGVTFDNKAGIIEGIRYLVEGLGVQKICMLKTADHNSDITERYEVYVDMMNYYGLEIKENSVITTTLSSECIDDCQKLLDLNPDAEAVICPNDDVALGLYSVMEKRGLIPGKDIRVMGFDNSIRGSMITPSLTTVEANAIHLGSRLFTMVRLLMEGWDVTNMVIPTRFILRDSFGSLLDKENVDERILDKNYVDEYFERIFFKYDSKSMAENFEMPILFKSIMNIIIDYVNDETYNSDRVDFLKTKVKEFFKTGALSYSDSNVLLAYVDRVKSATIKRFDSYERKCHAYETFSSILKLIIRSSKTINDEYTNIQDEYLFSLKDLVESTLNSSHPGDEAFANIADNLQEFGVKNAYIYIYEKPIVHKYGEDCSFPETLLLKTAMNDGNITMIPENEQSVSIDNIFNNKYITSEKLNLVLMPLYFREKLYGSILYDLNDISYRSGDLLADQYATVARIVDIVNR